MLNEIITEFYYRSLRGSLKEFNFEAAWGYMRPSIEEKLHEHAQIGTVEGYQQRIEDIYGDITEDLPCWATIQTGYVYFTKYDVANAIISAQHKCLKEAFAGTYDNLIDMIHKMDSVLSLEEKTILFDAVIHAEHATGNIFDDIDTEECKKEAELMFEEHEDI